MGWGSDRRKHPLTLIPSKCEPHTPPRPNSPAPDPAPSPLAGEVGVGDWPFPVRRPWGSHFDRVSVSGCLRQGERAVSAVG